MLIYFDPDVYSAVGSFNAFSRGLGLTMYCGDEFLIKTKYVYKDGKRTSEPISKEMPGKSIAYYNTAKNVHILGADKDEELNTLCVGETRAFVLQGVKSLVICPSAFSSSLKTLQGAVGNQAGLKGKSIQDIDAMSLPGILLHELTHMLPLRM